MCCSTAAMPRCALRRYGVDKPIVLNRCQEASSNLPTYHMTFMWPTWSQCQG